MDATNVSGDTSESMTPSMVPAYQRDSEFGASLNYDDDEEFSVPIGVAKPTPEAGSLEDLSHLFATVRFWGLPAIPVGAFEFLFSKDPADVVPICDMFAKELPQMVIIAEMVNAPSLEERMGIAMRSGYLDLVKYWHSKGAQLTDHCARLAIQNGRADCLEFALLTKYLLGSSACTEAVKCGNAACIQVVLRICPLQANSGTGSGGVAAPTAPCYYLCDAAACVGDVEYLKRVRSLGWFLNGQTATVAASNGQLDCLKYLHETGCPWADDTVASAVDSKQFDCAAYALEHGAPLNDSYWLTMEKIVEAGELRCLKLLPAYAFEDGNDCYQAAWYGHLDCLVYLREQRHCEWDATVTTAAAENGHYECLWYAIQHGCPVDQKICSVLATNGGEQVLMTLALLDLPHIALEIATVAAAHGFMNCLTYVIEHGCRKLASVCAAAAAGGQLACLQYLHEQGFHLSVHTTNQTARTGHFNCLEYVLQHNCRVDVRTCECLAARGELSLLQQVIRKCGGIARAGCIDIMAAAARHGQLACLQYLHEQLGFPVMDKVVSAAAVRKGQWECVRYLAQQGCAVARKALLSHVEFQEDQESK